MGDIGKHEDRQANESHHVDLANQIDKINYHYELCSDFEINKLEDYIDKFRG